jgi:hypothetical protein
LEIECFEVLDRRCRWRPGADTRLLRTQPTPPDYLAVTRAVWIVELS